MEALGAAATIVQLIDFTGEVLLKGYSFLSKVHKGPAEIRSLLREISNLNALLGQLESLSAEASTGRESTEKEPRNALQTLEELGVFEDCNRLVHVVEKNLKACERVDGHELRNLGKKLIWPFKVEETKDTIDQIERLRETLSAAVVVDSAKTLRNVEIAASRIDSGVILALDGIAEIQLTSQNMGNDMHYIKDILESQMESEERLLIRKWLHPDGINIDASYTAALATRQSNTGQWLIRSNEFLSWKEKHGCLWLYGIAGCGKTVLSATVVDHLQRAPSSELSCVLYFFCDHRNPTMKFSQDLIHAIIKQLLDQNIKCFEDAKYWYEERLRPAGLQSTAAKPLSNSEYVGLIGQLCSRWKSVSLVVDALDECEELPSFVGVLKGMLDISNVKLLVTSRHIVSINCLMEPIADLQLTIMNKMGDDIEAYLRAEIHHRIELGTLKFKQKSLESMVLSSLMTKADGMILIAKMQLDYICRLKSDRAIKEALVKLPTDIYKTYDEILQQICTANPEDVEDAKRILQWLVFSGEPLTLQQLAEVLSIRPDDSCLDHSGIVTNLMSLADICGSLVTVHTRDTPTGQYFDLRGPQVTLITLAHASVGEYLTSGKIGGGLSSIFQMNPKTTHLKLGRICLQYVGFTDFDQILELPDKIADPLETLSVLRNQLKRRTSKYAFLDYACLHWPAHLRQSSFMDSPDDETLRYLDWFVHPDDHLENFASWQQVYHHDVVWFCRNRPSIFYAIEFRIDNLVTLLLPSDSAIDKLPDNQKWAQTPLHIAARCGALSTVQSLVQRGAGVEVKSGSAARAMTALHYAAEGGHTAVIKFLLEAGAFLHSRSDSLATPFYRAARSGSLKALYTLYEAGSNINAVTWDDFTPLFEAVAHGRGRTAVQLLKWGADPTIVTRTGENTLKLLKRARNANAEQSKSPLATEEDVLNDIKEIHTTGGEFPLYLKDLKPQYLLAMPIDLDSRPGIEREKDYRWSTDPSKIVTMSEYRDRDE